MLRTLSTLAALALLIGATPALTVDELAKRHVDALGGAAAVASIHSLVMRGWYREGTFRIDTYTAQMRPFYRVIGEPNDPLGEIHEGYDGSAWEYYPDPGIVVRTVGPAAASARHTSLFDDPFVNSQPRGITLTYRGEEPFNGNPAYAVHVRLPDGFEDDYFLDARTYLIAGRAQEVPKHAFGARYKMLDVYGDYRPEGGVMFHHTDREVEAATGKVFVEGGTRSVEINPDLSVAMFSPPDWKRTPLQQMIQRIYDERDETVAVVSTYRDFASIVDLKSEESNVAVGFTVKQILKMGHAETGVALQRLNVADHPNSARAHARLGTALATQGDRAAARDEFQTALRIDPANEEARSGLTQIQQ